MVSGAISTLRLPETSRLPAPGLASRAVGADGVGLDVVLLGGHRAFGKVGQQAIGDAVLGFVGDLVVEGHFDGGAKDGHGDLNLVGGRVGDGVRNGGGPGRAVVRANQFEAAR